MLICNERGLEKLGVRFPSTLHLDAFEALCGGVLGKAQVPGSACAAAVTQVDRGSAGLGDATAAVDARAPSANVLLRYFARTCTLRRLSEAYGVAH